MMEMQWRLRLNAGQWMLLKCDERGEWQWIRNLTEKQAAKLVHALEG